MQADGPLYQRWWKVCLFPRCCLPCNTVLHPCRASVSQNKRRYRQDGFDLDLTYVTSRIIVHGFPSTGVEHIYRNPRTEVQRLLEKYHKDHYKVYNFASEPGRTYPDDLFQGRVERYPFADHTCPPLESVVEFCENAKAWLDIDEQNVVSLHCKAGKGRAGIMAACLLIRLGETACGAVSTFDATRVSDMKGLTVVNQRKWPFLYERLVKEVWGVQDSIGMVPGQDPDLRAPDPRAACLREISLQLQPPAAGSRQSNLFVRNLSCAIFQQQPMEKTLMHRAKMVEVEPLEGEPGSVFAATLPRSVVVRGTFQVLIGGTVGTPSTKKNVIDLWWNTTFLAAEGGGHTFDLTDMDLCSPKLAERLNRAAAKLVILHTRPQAESPRRRKLLKPRATQSATAPDSAPETKTGAPRSGGEDKNSEEPPPGVSQRSFPEVAPPKDEVAGVSISSNTGESDGGKRSETANSAASTAGGDSAGGVPSGNNSVVAAGAADGTFAAEGDGVSSRAAPVVPTSEPNNHGISVDPSPALPGPSPAGMTSPVWTFEGRTPSNAVDPRTIDDSRWPQSNMPVSNHGVVPAGAYTPMFGASLKAVAPEVRLREKRRILRHGNSGSRSMDSIGHSAGSTSAPTRTSSSMRGDKALAPKAFAVQRGETDSESEDQVAVRASAFEGIGSLGPQEPTMEPSFIKGQQWAIEMEMAFAHERRRWEEHQRCLETELDWALAARARAEARSEEDSTRVEVLEARLSAWRSEYSSIGRDVKQAVRLLEMSLSGLLSAETALNQWRGDIPPEAYDNIMGCLTTGDVAPSNKTCGKE